MSVSPGAGRSSSELRNITSLPVRQPPTAAVLSPPSRPGHAMVCAPRAPPEGRPGKVSAERSWPPRCGRPDDGDSAKGVAEGRAEEAADGAGVSSAACNGGLPHDPRPPTPERDEGGEAQPPGDGDAAHSDGQTEGRVLDVMPLAFAAAQSSAVDSANGSMEDGRCIADSFIVEGNGGRGTDQLVRDGDDDTGNGDGRAVGSRADDGELETNEDQSRNKRWSTSAENPPPKRRAVYARRRFPPGCGSAAVTGIAIGGLEPSPMFERDESNLEIKSKIEQVGEATETHNCKIQESQVIDRVALDDFAGGQHVCDHPQNVITNYSPKRDFFEEIDDRTPLHEWMRVPLVAGDGDVRSECEESIPKGTPRTHPRGLVYVKKNGKRKLKHDSINRDSLNRSGKESKCAHHVATDQIEEKDNVDLTTKRVIIQALMAPDRGPWAQRKNSITSASNSPRNNVKKKDATPRQELLSKVIPSTSTRNDTREDQGGFSLEDDETSLTIDVHETSNGSCVTLPSCVASGNESVGTQSKVTKIDEKSPLHESEQEPLVTVDVKYEGSLQEGNLRTHVRGLVDVKSNSEHVGLVSVKVNVAQLDAIGIFEDGTPANTISSTQRRVTRSNMKVKQCIVARELKHDGIAKDPLDRSTKDSECGNILSTDQTKENDGRGLVPNTVVLALMAPDRYPWTQGKKSIASASQPLNRRNKYLTVREGLCLPDISEGKESIPICVINTIDDMQPMPFKYITKVIYPPSYEKTPPKGCNCTNGCSDSSECACAVKNEGEIPFNLNSAIVYTKPVIYECGPSCRCPPTCHNRVSQHGPKIRLEIFKTGKTGWGVRSPSFISSGSFICEYVGEVLQETEAERTENDEYLFDIGRDSDDEEEGSQSSTSDIMNKDVGYTIDAAKCGNVGRFINHSCSPNLHAQDVLWDHDDTRVPHVMLFAEKNIRPLQELTYDYNYNIGQVRQNGKEKIKDCFCGSSKCRLRLY
ncbi:uncharacterized protein [Lolium perenne]|uniref:uncharacterized protein n=1 Tax=Lolium perenne TaxID=4522 RepID=UPI0021F59414|nr:uncharacterized protein LOC127300771 [Lolium perenne]